MQTNTATGFALCKTVQVVLKDSGSLVIDIGGHGTPVSQLGAYTILSC
jgi:hypothetical protein